ncbi:Zinc transporter 2 [Aphelenchoides fujianensis]|nr:Zinc transporter 2 [Aphelenchoides fujianensis]
MGEIRYKRNSSELSSFRSDHSASSTNSTITTPLNIMGLQSQKEDFPLKHCDHEMAFQKSMKNDASRRAERTLIFVSLLTLVFIVAELIGGYLAHSVGFSCHVLGD